MQLFSHRFPHLDLAAALEAADVAMHLFERTAPGPDAPILVYPLNAASDLESDDFRSRQGLTLEQFVGQKAALAYLRQQLAIVLHDGQPRHSYAISYPTPQAEVRDYEVTLYRVACSPESAVAFSIATDVTERRRTERALRDAQDRLNSVISNIPVVLFVLDRNGVFLLSEGKGLAKLGLQPGQVVGLNALELYAGVPQIVDDIKHTLAGESPTSIVEVGDLIFESYFTPMRNEQGAVDGVLGVSVEISERVQAERERSKLQEQIISAQAAALAELSTPLIPINEQIVVVPLIGALDSHRASQLLETLLQGIEASRTRFAILDITGVPVIDTHVANALIRAAQAVSLLGAQMIITGIRPEVAQTLVAIDVPLANIITRSTLQSGIAYAMGAR